MAVEAPLSKSKLSIKLPAGIWALGFVSWRVKERPRQPTFSTNDGLRRRRATLVAQLLDLETPPVGRRGRNVRAGLFTKARKSLERRYQATAREVADFDAHPLFDDRSADTGPERQARSLRGAR